ncbi:hypothetical protein Q8F55_007931 [Vanrija albida]|uniref:Uncharacterized protein n=1 Tax=Vanrija albida TaxID=181172 RepID=A0ABR3PUV8_9TREE
MNLGYTFASREEFWERRRQMINDIIAEEEEEKRKAAVTTDESAEDPVYVSVTPAEHRLLARIASFPVPSRPSKVGEMFLSYVLEDGQVRVIWNYSASTASAGAHVFLRILTAPIPTHLWDRDPPPRWVAGQPEQAAPAASPASAKKFKRGKKL